MKDLEVGTRGLQRLKSSYLALTESRVRKDVFTTITCTANRTRLSQQFFSCWLPLKSAYLTHIKGVWFQVLPSSTFL